jgi:hypothetical protein
MQSPPAWRAPPRAAVRRARVRRPPSRSGRSSWQAVRVDEVADLHRFQTAISSIDAVTARPPEW